jgi:hypothetical protein
MAKKRYTRRDGHPQIERSRPMRITKFAGQTTLFEGRSWPKRVELRTTGCREISSIAFRFWLHSDESTELDLALPAKSGLDHRTQK